MNLLGYSLPLSPSGQSSLVSSPPWYFGGDVLEIAFLANKEILQQFIPSPLKLCEDGIAAVSIVDMTSISEKEFAYDRPELTQYRECLLKILCEFEGRRGWFVPTTWVNTDFSLLRGFIQGFGKQLGQIHITKFHKMNTLIGERVIGSKIKGICEVFNSIHISLGLSISKETTDDYFKGISMFVMRHYPDIENSSQTIVQELSELQVKDYRKSEILVGEGEINIMSLNRSEWANIQPLKVISARCFSEGFKLIGGKILHKY